MATKRAKRTLWAVVVLPFAACQCEENLAVIPGSVIGQVCDEATGLGIEAASLTLTTATGKTETAIADAQGSYVFATVPPGPATVSYLERTWDVEVFSREDTILTDPACRDLPGDPTKGAVDGQVCNRHTGELVTEAQVIVQAGDEAFVTSTDTDGRFLLENLPVGEHILTIQATGFQRSFAVTIAAGEIFHLDIGDGCVPTDAFHGSLSGALCDPQSPTGALVGARVTATDVNGDTVTDFTDTEGKFFLNALAPGAATVDIVRAPDVNDVYFLNVVAGTDVTVEYQTTCRDTCSVDVAVAPTVGVRPVDIIFVVDTSGSMDDDRNAVQQNLNSFSQQIAASGVDYRVVMIGEVNVPPPLGGSTEYLNIRVDVGSHSALQDLVQTYPQYSSFLREDSLKHFVAITDDESDMSSAQFMTTVNTWPNFDGWKFHSIVSFGNGPDGCNTGAGYGYQYVNLSQDTNGLMSPICGANYADVFTELLAEVTVATLPCTIAIPTMPSGARLDTASVSVLLNGQTTAVDGAGQCAGTGWHFDSATTPAELIACEDTCLALTQQASGTLIATFGCTL